MPEATLTSAMLGKVLKRMRLAAIGHRFYLAFLVFCGIFALILLTARFSGLVALPPADSTWLAFATIPLLAGLMAWLFYRRPTIPEAARLVDRSIGAQDLYLTISMLRTSAGEYQSLVVQSAEATAPRVVPERILPYSWQKQYWNMVWAPAVIAIGIMFLPQFDPFGKVAAAKLNETRNTRLDDQKKITAARLDEVKKQLEDHEESNPTDNAIDELKLTFNKMKADKKMENLKMLSSDQKDIGKLWRQISSEKLKDLMKSSAQSDQQFGANQDEKLKKMIKELQDGDAGSMQNELQDLKEQLQQLAAAKDPEKRSEIMQELKERMQSLQQMAREKMNNEPLASALDRAMQQMELSQNKGLEQDAMQAAMQSLELSEKEVAAVEQAVKDMKELEEALKTIQQAKKLNEQEKLEGGEKTGEFKSLADYEAFYAQMLADGEGQAGEGEGEGEGEGGGPAGFGKGGEMPEDDSVDTGFKNEQSKSAVVAGKMLLSMQTKGEAEKGEVVRDYKQLLQSVKQGAMEAMNSEQIPPGYHESIKGYFDTLEKRKEKQNK